MKFIFEMLATLGLLPKCLRKVGLFLLMLLLLMLALPAGAQTRLTPAWNTNLTLPASIGPLGNSNVTAGTLASQPIIVNPGYGAGLSMSWTNSGGGATNFGVFINVTPDGTNWLVPAPYYFEFKRPAGQLATSLTGTNMPAAWFDGFMQWRVDQVTNTDNANTVTNNKTIPSRRRLDYQ